MWKVDSTKYKVHSFCFAHGYHSLLRGTEEFVFFLVNDGEQERRCSDPNDISNLRVLIESGRTDQAMCTEGPSSKWEIDYREWKAWMRGGVRLGGGITVPILAMAPKWL